MVHLAPTPGHAGHPGLATLMKLAVQDAQSLAAGGVHGILVENETDHPHTLTVTLLQENCILKAVNAIVHNVSIPVGVNVLLNDWRASLRIAHHTKSAFIRVDVFVDHVGFSQDDQFNLEGYLPHEQRAHETRKLKMIEPPGLQIIAYQREIGATYIALLTDIQVKHKTLLETDKPITLSAQQAITAGAAALVVTGAKTGQETPVDKIRAVKEYVSMHAPHIPVLIGAGVNAANIFAQLQLADGAIIGTAFKGRDGRIDPRLVRQIINAVNN